MTTDLTAITPRGQRRQATHNDARTFHQPYPDDSHTNGKVTLKKNDRSPEARQSNHQKRRNTGPESASIQRKRIHRQSNPFLDRSESFAQDNRGEDYDDENKSSTLLSQDAAVESFKVEQPQRLQRLVASKVVDSSDCVTVPRQPSAETKNDPKPHGRSRQSSPHATTDQPRSRSTSKTRSKHSRESLGGVTSSSPVGSQMDSRRRSPSRENLNDSKTADLADMVKREVQRQVAEVEVRMLAEIDRRVEEMVRFRRETQTKEGRESSKRKTSLKEQWRRRE